jgi:uncharacterized protein YggL (DUF469 family)
MNTFQWLIPQDSMVTAKAIDDLTDVVIQVNAYRMISDETTSTQIPVCVGLTPPTEGFVPYDELTQEIVEGWLNENTDVEALDAELAIQLDNIINPKTVVLPNPF